MARVIMQNEKLNNIVRREMFKSMKLATEFLERRARANLTGRQITARIKTNPPRKVGLQPSLGGSHPKRVTGDLARSVTRQVFFRGSKNNPVVVGRVGTRLPRGRWLEFGTAGGQLITPRRARVLVIPVNKRVKFIPGRSNFPFRKNKRSRRTGSVDVIFRPRVTRGNVFPRPWLRPAVNKSKKGIIKILSRRWDM